MWVKIDDRMPDDPAVDRLSHGAFRLYVACICYCGRHLTDGFVPADVVPRLIRGYRPTHLAELRTVPSGETDPLLSATAGGYLVRNFLKFNPSKTKVQQQRRSTAARVARWRSEHGE